MVLDEAGFPPEGKRRGDQYSQLAAVLLAEENPRPRRNAKIAAAALQNRMLQNIQAQRSDTRALPVQLSLPKAQRQNDRSNKDNDDAAKSRSNGSQFSALTEDFSSSSNNSEQGVKYPADGALPAKPIRSKPPRPIHLSTLFKYFILPRSPQNDTITTLIGS